MHKSFKHFALAGAAMALALTPALAGAQDRGNPETGMPTDTGTTPPTTQDKTGTETGSDTTGTVTETVSPETTTPPTNPDPANTDAAGTATTSSEDPAAATDAPTGTMTLADQQAAIRTWPRETQAYYGSLTDERQRMFWALSDTDKVRLANLPDAQKELAWTQIEAQIKPPKG